MEYIETDCLYGINDMVRAGCADCAGCHSCCVGMGDSILLDPYDVCLLTNHLSKTMDELLQKEVELYLRDGLVLPNIAMQQTTDACGFLDKNGRCSIHAFRPGICRLFPLGRQYEDGEVKYFLVPGECTKENKTKVKVKKWLGVENIKAYQQFLVDWHDFKKQLMEAVETEADEVMQKNLNMFLLNHFYRKTYKIDNFYEEFAQRLQMAKDALGL